MKKTKDRIVLTETERNLINYLIEVTYLDGGWSINICAHLNWSRYSDNVLWEEVISMENSDIPSLLVALFAEIEALEPKGSSHISIGGLRDIGLCEPDGDLILEMIKICAKNNGFKCILIA